MHEFSYTKLIDWAIVQLKKGIESENILILAGLNSDNTKEEILTYFENSIDENKYDIPQIPFTKIMEKLDYIVNAMNKNYLSSQSTLKHLTQLCIEFNYDNLLLPFYSLDDEIDLLLFENNKIFKMQTGTNTLEEYIFEQINLIHRKIKNPI